DGLAARGDPVIEFVKVPAAEGAELEAPGQVAAVGQPQDVPPAATQQLTDLPGVGQAAERPFGRGKLLAHRPTAFRASMACKAAAICPTSSSAKTRQLPATAAGRMPRDRMTYSTRWSGSLSRRAISPTVSSLHGGQDFIGHLQLLEALPVFCAT